MYVVVQPHLSRRDSFLSVREGQLVEVLESSGPNWLVMTVAGPGEMEAEGFLPASCLKRVGEGSLLNGNSVLMKEGGGGGGGGEGSLTKCSPDCLLRCPGNSSVCMRVILHLTSVYTHPLPPHIHPTHTYVFLQDCKILKLLACLKGLGTPSITGKVCW